MVRTLAGGVLGLVLLAPMAGIIAFHVADRALGPPPLANAQAVSVTVLDRNDRLLRAYTTKDDRWRLPVTTAQVDPRYIAMLLAFEDRRFRDHGGVDALAFVRAGTQLLRHGRIVSGGSTLTMQVARLLEARHERSATGKLRQIVRALQIEARLSKREILDLYLRLAPFGGNVEGVRAATLGYFGKEPRRLSIGEAALLVAIPQSPERRRPGRAEAGIRLARDRVLAAATREGVITPAEAAYASREPLPRGRRPFPMLAPHLADSELAAAPNRDVHELTIDSRLQDALETLAAEHARAAGQRLSAAILVADHRSGEILAHVGSAGYLDRDRAGAIDMTGAVRSPGSTLKPIIYGLAFESGLAHPQTLIEDRPTRFGTYRPKNFGEDFHGTVSIRHALAQSLNIPAVKVLDAIGPPRLMGRLTDAGLAPLLPDGAAPSLAVALGGVGLTLHDLAQLYAGLGNGGGAAAIHHRRRSDQDRPEPGTGPARERRVLTPLAAWYVSDILRSAPPPAHARGGRIAYKTGTSYGYRDAWAVGYDGHHTVAVWIGRPDGTGTPGLTGRTAAAPILFDAFQRIGTERAGFPAPPTGALRVSGADLPPPLKRFGGLSAGVAEAATRPPVAIAFPPDRAEVDLAAQDGLPLVLKAEGGALPLTWLIDGRPITSAPHRRQAMWEPIGRGFVDLSVIDAEGRSDRVTVRLR